MGLLWTGNGQNGPPNAPWATWSPDLRRAGHRPAKRSWKRLEAALEWLIVVALVLGCLVACKLADLIIMAAWGP